LLRPDHRYQIDRYGKPPALQDLISRPTSANAPAQNENLPAAFWAARPALAHIQQAAHAATRSADAVLAFTLARIAATILPTVMLPAVVGAPASLNYLVGIVAHSGGGKSSAGAVARRLIPLDSREGIAADLPLGSGEGLTECYFGWVYEKGDEGKTTKVKLQVLKSAYLYLDEGQALAEMGNRKGATLMPTIRSGWSGETIGQTNASQETKRILPAHQYRMALVVGFQYEYAAALIADTAGGTPQRFLFASAHDPNIPDRAPHWPGELQYDTPLDSATETIMDIEDGVAVEIRARALSYARGEKTPKPLDAHRDLARLKTSGLLAILDGRMTINAEDWELSGQIHDCSDAVRNDVIAHGRRQTKSAERARIGSKIREEAAITHNAEKSALESGSKSLARRVHKEGTAQRGDLNRAVSSKHKALVALDQMIEHAEDRGWIVPENDTWNAGASKPV